MLSQSRGECEKKSGNDAVYRNSAAPERSEPEPEFIVGPVVYAG